MLVRMYTNNKPYGMVIRVYEIPDLFKFPDMLHYETIGENIMM